MSHRCAHIPGLVVIICTLLVLTGCPNGFGPDGGTDSDGDGFTDTDELSDYNFDPTSNPFKFNPLVADIPRIAVEITSLPTVIVNYQRSDSETVSVGTSWSQSQGESVSTSTTSTESRTTTHQAGISIGVEHEFSATGGTTVKAEASYQYASTNSTSNSFTRNQTIDKRETYGQSKTMSDSTSYTFTDASLSVVVNISNIGHIAFTLTSITLSAVEIDPASPDRASPICTLNFDDSRSAFQEVSLGPGSSFENWIFTNTIDLDTAHHLLRDTQNLIIDVTSYELVDEEGRSFTHDMTRIGAKTAIVSFDYGVGSDVHIPEKYMVATETDEDTSITVGEVMNDILMIPYTTGTTTVNEQEVTTLVSVRDREVDTATGGWIVVHGYTELGEEKTSFYSPEASYDFTAIELKPGNTLSVIYVEDADHDGLTARDELLYGTDDTNTDTDGDGVSDFDEIEAGTNPLLTPADGEEEEPPEDTTQTISDVTNFAINHDEVDNDHQAVLTWDAPVTDPLYRRVLVVRDVGHTIAGVPKIGQSYSVGGYITDPDNPATQYEIVYIGSESSFTDTGLTDDTTYHYKIFATDMQGGIGNYYSEGVEESVQIPADPCTVTIELDYIEVVDEKDGTGDCELYWDIKASNSEGGNETLDYRSAGSHWSAADGDRYTNFSDPDWTFELPQDTSSTFTIDVLIMEDDGTGDDTCLDRSWTYTYGNSTFSSGQRVKYSEDYGEGSEDSTVKVAYTLTISYP